MSAIDKTCSFMTIDPSINTLGVALYHKKKLQDAWLLKPKKSPDYQEHYMKTISMTEQLMDIAQVANITHVVMEVPEYWGTDGFIARETGSIAKMMFLCGGLYCLAYNRGLEVVLVTPREWKGQLPKDVVRRRLTKFFVPKYYTEEDWLKLDHNVMDAVAIGHFWITGRV